MGMTTLENISGGQFDVGEVVQVSAQFRWFSLVPVSGASPCRPFLRINPRKTDNSFGNPALALYAASGDNVTPNSIPASGALVACRTRSRSPRATDRLYVGPAGREPRPT
jgi:hypothetical protein